jgi:hypothetical protein
VPLVRFLMRRKALDLQFALVERKQQAEEEEKRALEAKKAAEDELAYKISR